MKQSPYIQFLQETFQRLHHCKTSHLKTVPVIERFKGRIIWDGEVEVFELTDHPKAVRGYAWGYDKRVGSETITVLEIPPITSPQDAVKVAIAGKVRELSQN